MVRAMPQFGMLLVLCAALVLSLTATGSCQDLGMESYSFIHPFGLTTATTTRQFGMGGQTACVWDEGFANPAFAATQKAQNAGVRLTSTQFSSGPELVSTHAHWVVPLRPDHSGLQLSLFSLETRSGQAVLMGSPSHLDLRETDIAVDWATRVGSGWVVGLSLAAVSKLKFDLRVPGGGPTLLRIDTEPTWGGRLGLLKEWGPDRGYGKRDYIGALYDYYQEDATGAGLLLDGTGANTFDRSFHNSFFAAGASRHLSDDLMVAAEWARGVTHDGGLTETLTGWHFGAEYELPSGVALRAGMQDERTCFGFGVDKGHWKFDYAYMNRWNNDIAADLVGGSETHQVECIISW
jgi:hypothetical protein